MKFTVLPFLLAMVVAISNMPIDIYQICAWNHGTEKTEPWRSKLSTLPVVQQLIVLSTRVREWGAALLNAPAWGHLASEVGAVGNIKQLIQDETENKAAIRKAKAEGRTLAALKERTPEQATRFDAVFAELDVLEAKAETIETELAQARRLQDDERREGEGIITPGKSRGDRPCTPTPRRR
jgi:hypothetical protein